MYFWWIKMLQYDMAEHSKPRDVTLPLIFLQHFSHTLLCVHHSVFYYCPVRLEMLFYSLIIAIFVFWLVDLCENKASKNHLWDRWPMELRLSPVSVVLSGWETLTPPGQDTKKIIHHRLASSRHWYSFTYPGRKEIKVELA